MNLHRKVLQNNKCAHRKLLLLALPFLLALSCAQAQEEYTLEDIASIIQVNLDRISIDEMHSFRIVQHLRIPNTSGSGNTEHSLAEWAYSKDGRVLTSFESWSEGDIARVIGKSVFDGVISRTILFEPLSIENNKTSLKPSRGYINPDPESTFFKEPPSVNYSLQLLGMLFLGRNLHQWISDDGARIVGRTKIGQWDSVVVEVPEVNLETVFEEHFFRFYLVPEYHMAMVRYEDVGDGKMVLTVEAEDFAEIDTDFWMPTAGTVTYTAPPTFSDVGSYTFEIELAVVDPEFPPGFFELEFPDGLPVIDRRFGYPVTFNWNQGLSADDPTWINNIAEDLQSQHIQSEGPSHETAQESDLNSKAGNESSPVRWLVPSAALLLVSICLVFLVRSSRLWSRKGNPNEK